MKWKYCDFCGSISIKRVSFDSKYYNCPKCQWEGIPNEGSMEHINVIAKKYRPGTLWSRPNQKKEVVQTNDDDKSTLLNKIDESDLQNDGRDFSKVPKNEEIMKRVRKKDFGDAEFL